MKVKFDDLMHAIEFHSDMGESFIYLKTGEVCFISDEVVHTIENDGDHPIWMSESEINTVKQYLENSDDFMGLPSQYDINEYQMMEDFALVLADEKAQGQLLIALRGKGAFRRFKDSVIFLGIEKDWYQFRENKYKQFITEWCEIEGITLCDEGAKHALTD